ncbi:MAG: ATP-binding protein [Bacteroidota bacterium]|nr:ATP-binding protein [Bacteroidota bacterium]
MPEQQNIEYKQTWHDDYLKLMDEIPNKIRNLMGIIADVNLHKEKDHHFIELIVPPYSVPISLRGRYYYRSGSTKQELTGASLNEFLLKKSGKTWDEIIEPRDTSNDIDEQSIKFFLHASEKAGRLPEYDGHSLPDLLEKLRLTENGQLKRATIILFGKEPGKFYPNTFVKIGRFGKGDADLKFQEVEDGNLFSLLSAVLNQLNRKFFTKPIDFEGMHRIEKGAYPVAAIREMMLNALVHRSYMGAPIQIRIYDDKISIWNEGFLPEGLTLDALKRPHPSRPRNPIIADVCFKGGYIDAWGRGTIKILDSCKAAELPEPEMKEQDGGFLITLFKDIFNEEYLVKLGLNERQKKAIYYIKVYNSITNTHYQNLNNVSKATATRDIKGLVEKGLIENRGSRGSSAIYVLKGVGS